MSGALTKTNGNGVAPMNLDPMTIARAFKESGMFPDLRSEAQAVVKIVAGQEVGFGPMASMQAVQMIQGKPTFSANALAALVKKHPSYNYRSIEHTAEVCRLQFYENGEEAGVSEFSMEDAKAAGLLGNNVWRKYPKAMLFARALSQGVRWYAPDVTAGAAAYVPEELGAEVDGEGEVVEQTAPEPAAIEAPEPEPISEELAKSLDVAIRRELKLPVGRVQRLFGAVGAEAPEDVKAATVKAALSELNAEQAEQVRVYLQREADRRAAEEGDDE